MEKVLNQQEIDEMVRAARAGNASAGATGPAGVGAGWVANIRRTTRR